jgi:hypothetical protein
MSKVLIKFVDQPVLVLSIIDDIIGQKYFKLIQENYQAEKPIFRDRTKYTIEYMHELAKKASEVLEWEWYADNYNIVNTIIMHKDIEKLVGNGFDKVPAEYDHLIHELHYCLHAIQDGRISGKRDAWLQIEWYNDSGFELDKNYSFKRGLKFGEIKLQNPWVGHGPLQIFLEKDFTNISQTCKFHNFVKPGINIVIEKIKEFNDIDKLIEEFYKHDPTFVEKHTVDVIKKYIGYPVVGQVLNLNDLYTVIQSPTLDLEWIDFE